MSTNYNIHTQQQEQQQGKHVEPLIGYTADINKYKLNNDPQEVQSYISHTPANMYMSTYIHVYLTWMYG